MKRILFFVVIVANVFMGCKKDGEERKPTIVDGSDNVAQINCETNEVMIAMRKVKPEDIIQWVKDNGDLICANYGELQECLEPFHKIETEDEFEVLATSHSSNRTTAGIIYYPKKWSEIQTYIKDIECYQEYIGFDFSGTDVNFKKISIDDFENTKESCYSKPFLEGLGKQLGPDDMFYFTKAKYSGSNGKVIFYVSKIKPDNTYDLKYYNISDYPGIVDFKKFAKK